MPNLFNTTKHGYNPEEVDNYIRVLEDVISEYKEKDNAIRNAIVNAQVAADNIIRNAELVADEIKTKAMSQLTEISRSIDSQRLIIEGFQEQYNQLVLKYLMQINETDFDDIYEKIDELQYYLLSLRETRVQEEDGVINITDKIDPSSAIASE